MRNLRNASFKLTLDGCVVYACCVGFASVGVVCVNSMIVPGMLVGISFLISVCMFIVSKALLISSATVIVRAGRAILLNPFATVLFNVCNDVIVVLCFVPVLHGCVWYGCCYVRKKGLLQCLCNY